jgi:SAM-dependent methyltransferase
MTLRILLILALALPLAAQRRPEAPRWDQIYAGRDAKVPVNPSALVLETLANAPAGAALDIGMGNGRNAIYLARKGWKVTGIDISSEAVKLAQAEAKKLKVPIEASVGRFEDLPAYLNRYDAILCMYVEELTTKNAKKIMDMLKPGGLLVVEGYHLAAPGQRGYATNQLLRTFNRLHIVRYEDREMQPEWSLGPGARVPVIRLVARKD